MHCTFCAVCGSPLQQVMMMFKLLPLPLRLAPFLRAWLWTLLVASAPGLAAVAPQVHVEYHGELPLAQLTAGASGSGTLLYYTSAPERPQLIVQLDHTVGSTDAVARVYDASTLRTPYIPVQLGATDVTLPGRLKPTLTLIGHGGWWTRAQQPNYDLDILVFGQAYAMWGEGYDQVGGPSGPAARIRPGDPAVSIRVRPDQAGWPRWDERRLLPDFGSSGYIRYNYAERKCAGPLRQDPGLTPLWPYVAETGGYEQPSGQLRAPLVVDWEKARITHVSELVTVRQQNCSYALYSIAPVYAGQLNRTDFESPLAFYDLSGEGTGAPNLVLRTERYFPGDGFSIGLDARLAGVPVSRDFQTVRYSWRTAAGDRQWNYKVEVQGSAPYTGITRLGDGAVRVDAPSYETYPAWVVQRPWPAVTFAAAEGHTRHSSEGIYTYSPRELGVPYLLGNALESDSHAFSNIETGFRGEYRYNTSAAPQLYLSSLDGRMHLLGAEGGVWPVSPDRKITVKALGGGRYINHWRLQQGQSRVKELARLGSTVLLLADHQLEITETAAPEALWVGAPPTTPQSWRAFRTLTGSNLIKPAPDLQVWFGEQPGKTRRYTGVTVGEVSSLPDGLQFDLEVQSARQQLGTLAIPALDQLRPGRYTVRLNRNGWTVKPQVPARLEGSVSTVGFTLNTPGWLSVKLRNVGTQIWKGPADLQIDRSAVYHWNALILPGQSQQTIRVAWTPLSPGSRVVVLTGIGSRLNLGVVTIAPPIARVYDVWRLYRGSAPASWSAALLGVIVLTGIVAGVSLWRRL